jgi:hypothetical protein
LNQLATNEEETEGYHGAGALEFGNEKVKEAQLHEVHQ